MIAKLFVSLSRILNDIIMSCTEMAQLELMNALNTIQSEAELNEFKDLLRKSQWECGGPYRECGCRVWSRKTGRQGPGAPPAEATAGRYARKDSQHRLMPQYWILLWLKSEIFLIFLGSKLKIDYFCTYKFIWHRKLTLISDYQMVSVKKPHIFHFIWIIQAKTITFSSIIRLNNPWDQYYSLRSSLWWY